MQRGKGSGEERLLRGTSAGSNHAKSPPRDQEDGDILRRAITRDENLSKQRHPRTSSRLRLEAQHEQNNDCQVVVNEQGMTLSLSGQHLTTDRPAHGVVTDGEYVFYVVSSSVVRSIVVRILWMPRKRFSHTQSVRCDRMIPSGHDIEQAAGPGK